ncbi:hypothetical protein DJ533_00070 (plasmid) [Acinetobacter defluvii]|uniref:Uncharacterized protein n=1 Tax=Acinetobacter defluvii TaxID=1871111 RepID=A0A2S2F8G4_9GAMM|nr:hypothetical protein [Acinetobacter defluvii]AWL27115.1 hypothetical protein DJ533_00070 [Acinetobacter defluvii]
MQNNNKQNWIIAILSTILVIILVAIGVFGFWFKGAYEKLNETNKDSNQTVEVEEEQPVIVQQQEEVLPSCYDSYTLDTLRGIVYQEALSEKDVKSNQLAVENIENTQLKFQDIATLSESDDYNPIRVCEAKLDMTYPYMTQEQIDKLGSDFLWYLHFSGKKNEYTSLPKSIKYEIKFVHNEDGEKQVYVEMDHAKSYAFVVYFMGINYYSKYQKSNTEYVEPDM